MSSGLLFETLDRPLLTNTWAGLPIVGTKGSWAVFSPCKTYRYVLGRQWTEDHELNTFLFVIMLNPSTADEVDIDPTVRRCVGFAKRDGHAGLVVRNVFAYRSTYPIDLMSAADPVGPENEHVLNYNVGVGPIVAAWGCIHPKLRAKMPRLPKGLRCFGTTKDGSPKHPLYLKKTARIIPFGAS